MAKKFDEFISKRISEFEEIIKSLEVVELKKQLIKVNWLESIQLMEYLTKKHYWRYNVLNLISIIGGILIPVTINIITDEFGAKLTATILGVLVSISSGINQSYRLNDRWRHYRTIAEELKIEGERFFTLSDNYKSYESHDESAFKQFMGNTNSIKENQIRSFMTKITENNTNKKDDSPK